MSTANPRPNSDDLDLGETIRGLASGTVIFDRFVIEKILGRGGMGIVWLAKDRLRNLNVALKFMPEIVSADAASKDDLRKETRNGLNLSHPNVVRMIDLVEEDQAAAIVMEYVDGKTLASLRLDQPEHVFEVAVLKPWVEQMLDGLEHAHRDVKLIHRDLKPANLMVNSEDVLKVADFGIASSIRDSVSRVSRKASAGAGTLPYMSPQQMMGEVPTYTDDIYSLGATLFELLTGKPPFYAGDLPKQIESIVPPSITERRRQFGIEGDPIPAAWETVIAACLEKDARDRPADIAAVRIGLTGQKFKRGSGSTTARTTRRGVGGRPAISGSVLAIAATGVLLVGAGLFYWGSYLPEQKRLAKTRQDELIRRQDEEKKKTIADEALLSIEEKVESANRKEDSDSSAKTRFDRWNELNNDLRDFDYAFGDEDDRLRATVKTKLDKAKSKMDGEKQTYNSLVARKQKEFDELQAESKKEEVGAASKKTKWDAFFSDWKGEAFNADYGSAHLVLFADAKKQRDEWTVKANAEAEAAKIVVGFPMCFGDGPIARWDQDEKRAAIAIIQNVLLSEGLRVNAPDGNYDEAMHHGIVKYQQRHDLPLTGKLDQYTLKEMQVPTDAPPKKQIAQSGIAGGTNSKSSGSSGRGKNSGGSSGGSGGGVPDWTKWLRFAPGRF
jgi:serine/threonine protein kinase